MIRSCQIQSTGGSSTSFDFVITRPTVLILVDLNCNVDFATSPATNAARWQVTVRTDGGTSFATGNAEFQTLVSTMEGVLNLAAGATQVSSMSEHHKTVPAFVELEAGSKLTCNINSNGGLICNAYIHLHFL